MNKQVLRKLFINLSHNFCLVHLKLLTVISWNNAEAESCFSNFRNWQTTHAGAVNNEQLLKAWVGV